MRHYLLVITLALPLAACLRSTTYTCQNDSQCTGAGSDPRCDTSVNACTFADSSCTTSGRRYADNSGSYSGRCVGDGPGPDSNMGNEVPPGGEPAPMGCPADFVQMGPRNHGYKALPNMAPWAMQRDACAAFGTFLAYPDGATLADAQAELAIIKTLSQDGAWVGISDLVVEGSYTRSSDNMPISAITNMLLNIGGNQGEKNAQDCLIVANDKIDDASCNDNRRAVCECVP